MTRMPGLMSSNVDELWDPKARIAHCVPVVADVVTVDRGYVETRVISSAAMFLGVNSRRVRHLAATYNRKGGTLEKFFEYYEHLVGQDCPNIDLMALHHVGFIYRARMRSFPWIEKIGFSRDPYKRMRNLSYQTGFEHDLEDFVDGCFFDEARSFLARRRDNLKGEWFFDPDREVAGIPDFLQRDLPMKHWESAIARSRSKENVRQDSAFEIMWRDERLCGGAA